MKTVKMAIAVAADKLADVIEALQALGVQPAIVGSDTMATADDDDDVVQPATTRKVAKVAKLTASVPGNRGKAVVYTPAMTQAKIDKILAGLRKNTVGAFVLADISRHPGTSKSAMLARLTPKLAKHELSADSVDNAVWLMQKKAIVKSVPVSDE